MSLLKALQSNLRQESFLGRFTTQKLDENVHRIPLSSSCQDEITVLAAESLIQHAFLLEDFKKIGGKDFTPKIAVVCGGVACQLSDESFTSLERNLPSCVRMKRFRSCPPHKGYRRSQVATCATELGYSAQRCLPWRGLPCRGIQRTVDACREGKRYFM